MSSGNGTTPPPFSASGSGLLRLADVVTRPVRWMWPGMLPYGKMVEIIGDPGMSKSTIALDLIARVTTGGTMPDGTPVPIGNALILTEEDDPEDTLGPRLDAVGTDRERVAFLRYVRGEPQGEEDEGAPERPTFPTYTETVVRLLSGVSIFMIDPVSGFLDRGLNDNSTHDVRMALGPLAERINLTATVGLLVRHPNKDRRNTKALHRGSGSLAFSALARVGMWAGEHPEDARRRVLAVYKNNLWPAKLAFQYHVESQQTPTGTGETTDVPIIAWEGASEVRADDLLQEPQTEKQEAAREFLAKHLGHALDPATSVPTKEMKKAAQDEGINVKLLEKVMKRMGVKYTRPGEFGGNWCSYWPGEARH